MPSACALGIFSGRIILNFGFQKSLRTFLKPIFTKGVVKGNGRCRDTPSVLPLRVKPPSPRGRLNSLSQNLTVLPAPSGREPLAWRESLRFCQGPHLRGGCRRRRLGEFYPPQRRAFAESGAANAVFGCDPSRENAMPERPQTLRHCSIKNNFSAIYAQSKAERILNRSYSGKCIVRKARRFPPPCPAPPAAKRSACCAVRRRCRRRSCWRCRSAPVWG